jgi:hypothetical protein
MKDKTGKTCNLHWLHKKCRENLSVEARQYLGIARRILNGAVTWICLAQERAPQWILVKTAMNIWNSQTVATFLCSWTATAFTKRTYFQYILTVLD